MPPDDNTASTSANPSGSDTGNVAVGDVSNNVDRGKGIDQNDNGDGSKQTDDSEKIKLPPSIKPPGKPSGRFQQRISDLVAQRDGARHETEQLRQQLSKFQNAGDRAANTGDKAKAVSAGDELNPDDFNTYGEYVTALVTKTMQQGQEAAKSKQAEEAYTKYHREKIDEFTERCQPLGEAYGDGFWEAISDPHLPVSEVMVDAIIELGDLAPYTMLWLAGHHQEALKIARMNPRQATIAIGRLAAQLDFELKQGGDAGGGEGDGDKQNMVENNQARQTTTPQPKPVNVPRGSVPTNIDGAPNDKDDVQTWLKKESARIRKMNPNARFYGA